MTHLRIAFEFELKSEFTVSFVECSVSVDRRGFEEKERIKVSL